MNYSITKEDKIIIEYDNKYDDDIEELLYQLQEHIMNIDIEGYNIISKEHKKDLFNQVMNEIKEYNGKIFLYKENDKILGFIVGQINNEETNSFNFKAPKRGRITELVVDKNYRRKSIGDKLLSKMESYLKDNGCKSILIGVFAYNDLARRFYEKHGYHLRMTDMIKVE